MFLAVAPLVDILTNIQFEQERPVLDKSFVRGRISLPDVSPDLDRSLLLVQIRADSDESPRAYFIVGEGLTPEEAGYALDFACGNPNLLVDGGALAALVGIEPPALVTLGVADDAASFVEAAFGNGYLYELPSHDAVSSEGWELIWAHHAIERKRAIEGDELPAYAARELRRKVLSNRAIVEEDNSPWFEEELRDLRKAMEANPDGADAFTALVEDMEDAIGLRIPIDELFSVVVSTKVQRAVENGPIFEWENHGFHEVVVGHGLTGVQAARLYHEVAKDPARFVAKEHLTLKDKRREVVLSPYVIRDRELNWITVDLSGRRRHAAYEEVREISLKARASDLPGAREDVVAQL